MGLGSKVRAELAMANEDGGPWWGGGGGGGCMTDWLDNLAELELTEMLSFILVLFKFAFVISKFDLVIFICCCCCCCLTFLWTRDVFALVVVFIVLLIWAAFMYGVVGYMLWLGDSGGVIFKSVLLAKRSSISRAFLYVSFSFTSSSIVFFSSLRSSSFLSLSLAKLIWAFNFIVWSNV